MRQVLLPAVLAASLLLLGCTGNVETRRTGEAPLPALVAQRVTATIQREAPRLVRLETEHEAFLTTPEHPFATPHSGWVSAGRLVPGDWVVSARLGAVRLLSVRSEPAARPVPVFNLSVASSHAYFVGTDRVLVHNTNCKRGRPKKDSEDRDKELAEAISAREELDRQIAALAKTDPDSPRLPELKAKRDKLRKRINYFSAKQLKDQGVAPPPREAPARPVPPPPPTPELAEAISERDELDRQIAALTETDPDSPRLVELKAKRDKVRKRINYFTAKQLKDLGVAPPPRRPPSRNVPESDPAKELAEAISERDELDRQIDALTKTDPKSPHLAELKAKRDKVRKRINYFTAKQLEAQGVPRPSRADRAEQAHQADLQKAQQDYAAEHEAARRGLEAARKELGDLEGRQPSSETESLEIADRRGELVRAISQLTLTYERANKILTWLRELAELEKATPATDAERREVEGKKKQLRADLRTERNRATAVKYGRNKRGDAEWRQENTKYMRDRRNRLLRTAAYLADTERDRDPLELAEAELAGLLQAPPSESRDARIHHLTELLEVMNRIVELRREEERLRKRTERDQQEELRLRAVRIEIAQLRLRERFLTQLDGTPWAHGPGSVDEAQLLEFQRQLTEGLVTDQRLAEIERALDAMDPTNADWEQAVLDEADDADEAIREWEEVLNESPSPQRAAQIQSSFERLQQELREERDAVRAALTALANESASIQRNQAGSSSGPTWQERLQANHQEQLRLRTQWQRRLRTRLNSAQQRLNFRRRIPALRDEAVEAELAREITLLEQELRLAGG